MASTFDIGETIICSVEVRNSAGTLVDPSGSMTIGIDRISPTPMTVIAATTAMTKDSTGKYHYDYDSASARAGNYKVVYKATDGTIQAPPIRITIEKEAFSLE